MPRGDKSSYSSKQKRKAEHIEEGYEKRGTSKKEAERRAWATVNKESGGGKKERLGQRKRREPLLVEKRRPQRRRKPITRDASARGKESSANAGTQGGLMIAS